MCPQRNILIFSKEIDSVEKRVGPLMDIRGLPNIRFLSWHFFRAAQALGLHQRHMKDAVSVPFISVIYQPFKKKREIQLRSVCVAEKPQ